jgi:hypothetical protein
MKRALLIGISLIFLFSPPLCLASRNVVKGRKNAEMYSYIEKISRELLIEEAKIQTLRSFDKLGVVLK